jgi:hypothetical protein
MMSRGAIKGIGAAAAAVAAASALGVAVSSSAQRQGAAPAAPLVDPAQFVRKITNPYLPLRPGAVWVYVGVRDGETVRDVVRVTHRTRMILGVRTTAVRDVLTHAGQVREATIDWYAQDRQGTVWYFGEATKSFEGGGVDTAGSWLAGRHGAKPGIVMAAHPQVGEAHYQEFWPGHAEDQYWLVDLRQHVTVPFGSFTNAALAFEWARLDPGVIDKKFYVRGIGNVAERSATGPQEAMGLLRFTPGT